MFNKILKLSLLAASVSTLVACGGGGGGSSDTPAPQQPTSVAGRAVDGPLAGSTVTFIDCENQTTITNATGYFNFPAGCTSSALIVSGGTDTGTDLEFEGTLASPKLTATAGVANNLVITPITTLIHNLGGADQATAIATALGLSGNLLTLDPTTDQNLYAKTVGVQQLVEEIQKAIGSLGTSSSDAELSALAFKAVAQALATAPKDGSNPLTNLSVISAALSNTLDSVKESLPEDIRNNLDNVKANLAALVAPSIAAQVNKIEAAIKAIPNFNAATDKTALIKAQTQAAIVKAKGSIALKKVLGSLGSLLVLDSTETASLLAQIAQNLNAENPDATSITAALTQLSALATKQGISIIVDDALVQSIVKSEEFYANFLQLEGLEASGTAYSTEKLTHSLSAPISIDNLDNLLIGVNAVGTYASTTQTIGAALKVASSNAETITVKIDKVDLSFNGAGRLIQANIASGAKLSLESASKNATFSLPSAVSVLSGDKLALNTQVLTQLLPAHLKDQVAGLAPKGATTITAILSPTGTTPVAYNTAKGLAVASKYTLGTSNGFGLVAKFNVAQ